MKDQVCSVLEIISSKVLFDIQVIMSKTQTQIESEEKSRLENTFESHQHLKMQFKAMRWITLRKE